MGNDRRKVLVTINYVTITSYLNAHCHGATPRHGYYTSQLVCVSYCFQTERNRIIFLTLASLNISIVFTVIYYYKIILNNTSSLLIRPVKDHIK